MLRLAARRSFISVRNCTSHASPPKRSTGGRVFLFVVAPTVVGTSGILAYAYYEPSFRAQLESNVPALKPVLQTLLGDARKEDVPLPPLPSLDEMKQKAKDALPKRKDETPTPPATPQITLSDAKKITHAEVEHELQKPRTPDDAAAVIAARRKAEQKVETEREAEFKRQLDHARAETQTKLTEARGEFEEDLRLQLQRLAAAHAEHLAEALKQQREQFEVEVQQRINSSLEHERATKHREVLLALARLDGIDRALQGRVDFDRENRRAKELWLAAQRVHDAVVFGRAAATGKIDKSSLKYMSAERRRKPLANELMAVREAVGNDDAMVQALINAVPDDALEMGVYTEEDLKNRFSHVKKLCRRTAMIGENGGTLLQYALSAVQSAFVFERHVSVDASMDEVDAEMDTFAVTDRASAFIANDDFENALRVLSMLSGEPARIAKSWMDDMRAHLETRQIAALLVGHATATSVRTIY